jgi:hypothetical protein
MSEYNHARRGEHLLSSLQAKRLDDIAHRAVSEGRVEADVFSVMPAAVAIAVVITVEVEVDVVGTKRDSALTTRGCLCADCFGLEVLLVLC